MQGGKKTLSPLSVKDNVIGWSIFRNLYRWMQRMWCQTKRRQRIWMFTETEETMPGGFETMPSELMSQRGEHGCRLWELVNFSLVLKKILWHPLLFDFIDNIIELQFSVKSRLFFEMQQVKGKWSCCLVWVMFCHLTTLVLLKFYKNYDLGKQKEVPTKCCQNITKARRGHDLASLRADRPLRARQWPNTKYTE